jgi:ketosteroid isomerase-like protein
MSTEPADTPTTTDARHLLARFVDALNSGDGAALAECVAPTYLQRHGVSRHLVTGTHLGSFLGHEPTGRSFRMHTAEFFRVADGRLAEHWDVWSPQGMLMQLGIIPAGVPFRTYG